MPLGIPPKKKRKKSNWMKGFVVAETFDETELYFREQAARNRRAFYRSTKSRRSRRDY